MLVNCGPYSPNLTVKSARECVERRVSGNNRASWCRRDAKTQQVEETAPPSLLNRLPHLQVIRNGSSAVRVVHEVCRIRLASVVAGRRTTIGITGTVGVSKGRHGHGYHHRCHNQSHRKDQKYALHCFSPPPLIPSSPRLMFAEGGVERITQRGDFSRAFLLGPTVYSRSFLFT